MVVAAYTGPQQARQVCRARRGVPGGEAAFVQHAGAVFAARPPPSPTCVVQKIGAPEAAALPAAQPPRARRLRMRRDVIFNS